MSSWFLGHRGENAGIMKETMNSIVDHVKAGRIAFGSDDEVRLPPFSHIVICHISRSSHLLLAGLHYHNNVRLARLPG